MSEKKNGFLIKKMTEKLEAEKLANFYEQNANKLNGDQREELSNILFDRVRFRYTLKDILDYFLKCGCLIKKKHLNLNRKMRNHFLFIKGEDKLFDELDCVTLLKSIR